MGSVVNCTDADEMEQGPGYSPPYVRSNFVDEAPEIVMDCTGVCETKRGPWH